MKKALIPVAGLGTRFLPATQSIAKEMLPLVDRPILLFIIEEAIAAGVEDVVLIQGRGKEEITDFFDCNYELEDKLAKQGQFENLKQLQKIRQSVNIISIRQQEAKGLGHAVWMGRSVMGKEPFLVLLGDELMLGDNQPCSDLVRFYVEHQEPVVSLMEVAADQVHKYGIADFEERLDSTTVKIRSLIEKPQAGQTSSRLALPGRYLFTKEIFDELTHTPVGRGGEIQLTDAMQSLCQKQSLYGQQIACQRFDTGNKLGYMQACIQIGLQHPEIGQDLRLYLQQLEYNS